MVKYSLYIALATLLMSQGCGTRRGLDEEASRDHAMAKPPTSVPSQKRFLPIEEAAFARPATAWLVTGNAELLRTMDGGQTWETTPSETVGGFAHVSIIDSEQGWAINYQGQVWSTNDGGRSWIAICQLSKSENHLVGGVQQLSFVNKVNGWIVEPFSVWRTSDGGVSWDNQELHRESAVTLTEAYFLNSETGWVADAKNNLHRTTNGGVTWKAERTRIVGDDIVAIFFVNQRIGWLSRRRNGGPYRTNDGRTWRQQKIPEDNNTGIDCIYFVNESEGWAGGARQNTRDTPATDEFAGILFHTTDGGASWRSVSVEEPDSAYVRIYFSDAQHGWLVGLDRVYYTDDAGLTWKVVLKLSRQQSS